MDNKIANAPHRCRWWRIVCCIWSQLKLCFLDLLGVHSLDNSWLRWLHR